MDTGNFYEMPLVRLVVGNGLVGSKCCRSSFTAVERLPGRELRLVFLETIAQFTKAEGVRCVP